MSRDGRKFLKILISSTLIAVVIHLFANIAGLPRIVELLLCIPAGLALGAFEGRNNGSDS